jgi:peptidoglycan LD-endopeptidase LytH
MRQLYLLLLAAVAVGCAAPSSGGILGYTDTRLSRRLDNEPPPSWLPVPVAGVRPSQLRDSWGDPRSGGRTHEGIDIFARRGTPVISATHGVVTTVHEQGLGGKSVTVRGPGRQSHYYAHLDDYGPHEVGDWVEAGDTLGYVGTTGNAQGGSPHLHYGIFTGGGAINPYPLLTARGDQVANANQGSQTSGGPGSTDQGGSTAARPSRRVSIEVPTGGSSGTSASGGSTTSSGGASKTTSAPAGDAIQTTPTVSARRRR